MEFLANKVRHFRGLFVADPARVAKKRELTKCEGYFELAYKVLGWEDITLTLCVFLVVNFLFWLVVQLELRLFGIAFLLALAAFVADFYLEGSPLLLGDLKHVEAFDELKNDVSDVVLSLKALRKDSPSSFCFGASVFFLTISFVAKNVSGYVIFYLSLLAVFFVPLVIVTYAPDLLDNFKRICRSLASDRSDLLAEDELIPFISDKDFAERDPDLDSLMTDRTADSVTNSLISGLTSMPSHLDEVDKDLEEEDLLPSLSGGRGAGEISSDSDSDHKAIRFEAKHFNGDSSSSDEDLYPKRFSSHDSVDPSGPGVLENILNVAGVSGSVIGNILKSAVINSNQKSQQIRKNSSSDDSEFEIINTDEADGQ